MSCNADRASIKYTKTLVHGDQMDWLESFGIDVFSFRNILDIGANRGTFCKHVLSNSESLARFHAVETDPDFEEIFLGLDDRVCFDLKRVENLEFQNDFYDFIYCIHTLEHVFDLKALLEKLRNTLTDDGYFYISVPNILNGAYDGFSEIFIDPHTIHFEYDNLKHVLTKSGFEIVHISEDDQPEIKVLVRRSENVVILDASISLDLGKYKVNLVQSREKLARSAQVIAAFEGYRIFWGAGRTFDALVRIGNLVLRDGDIVIDKSIGNHFETLFEKKVGHPRDLVEFRFKKDSLIIICAIEYYDDIVKECVDLGFYNYLKLF
jgi:2-polyprenyl-3-methyl-5-hydroxy-6-metoxy-1,4-benzoquinol methylase